MTTEKYFKVFYTKDLYKKHKHYNEGYLIIKKSRIELQDEEGKKISSGFSAKFEYDSEKDADVARIGSFLVEKEQEIKPEDFKSGKCYTSEAALFQPRKPLKRKKFNNPANNCKSSKEMKFHSDPNSIVLCDPKTNPRAKYTCAIDGFLAKKLMPHQISGIQFLFDVLCGFKDPRLQGAVLADSMGLGKTLQILTLMWTLMKQNPFDSKNPLINKCIIVTPVSLVDNWDSEITKW